MYSAISPQISQGLAGLCTIRGRQVERIVTGLCSPPLSQGSPRLGGILLPPLSPSNPDRAAQSVPSSLELGRDVYHAQVKADECSHAWEAFCRLHGLRQGNCTSGLVQHSRVQQGVLCTAERISHTSCLGCFSQPKGHKAFTPLPLPQHQTGPQMCNTVLSKICSATQRLSYLIHPVGESTAGGREAS